MTFFLATTFLPLSGWLLAADLFIAAGLALEFAARLYVSPQPLQYLRQPMAIVDMIVLASLLLPALAPNLGFLRLLRALRLVGTYNVLAALESEVPFVHRNLRAVRAAVNLGVFVFIVSAIVYVQQRGINPNIDDYLDALLLHGGDPHHHRLRRHHAGRPLRQAALATLVMIFGISLFLNLVGPPCSGRARSSIACPSCALLEPRPRRGLLQGLRPDAADPQPGRSRQAPCGSPPSMPAC